MRDFPDYYNSICGYMKISVLSENDYLDAIEKFQALKLDIPNIHEEDMFQWFHYKIDLFLLKYYYNYTKVSNKHYKDRIKQKIRQLYDKINNCYPEFCTESDLLEFKIKYDLPSHFKLRKHFEALIESGYPHQVLAFCYRTLIDSWSLDRILNQLANNTLDTIFSTFINEYTEQTDLPIFLISLYFIPLKENLNKKLKNIVLTNDSVTPVRLEKYIDWITGWTLLHFYFGKNREHDISDWCNKIKRKTLKNIIKNYDNVSNM